MFHYDQTTLQLILGNGRCLSSLEVPASVHNGPQRDQPSKVLSLTAEQANAYQPFGRAEGECLDSSGAGSITSATLCLQAVVAMLVWNVME
jgi:hypothetical protein